MEIKFLRQGDELGRLVIPIDLRRQYEINPGDKIRIIPQDNGIFIQAEKCVQNEGERGNGDRIKTP